MRGNERKGKRKGDQEIAASTWYPAGQTNSFIAKTTAGKTALLGKASDNSRGQWAKSRILPRLRRRYDRRGTRITKITSHHGDIIDGEERYTIMDTRRRERVLLACTRRGVARGRGEASTNLDSDKETDQLYGGNNSNPCKLFLPRYGATPK